MFATRSAVAPPEDLELLTNSELRDQFLVVTKRGWKDLRPGQGLVIRGTYEKAAVKSVDVHGKFRVIHLEGMLSNAVPRGTHVGVVPFVPRGEKSM